MKIQDALIDEDTTTIPVMLRNNCTVYNPCGGNGYCRNNVDGEWTCICKFWWNGTMCNELSNSGLQVIVLGVMLAVLLGLFYGVTIFRSIAKKRTLARNASKQIIPAVNRKFPTIPFAALHPYRRLFSWITGILTLILATSTLLAKWALIKPIHEDMVDKFKKEQPLFFKRHSVCRTIDFTADFNIFTFPFACFLILLFIITTKRVSSLHSKYCKGYFGIPIPLDYFAHVKRTLAAVIFAIFADELLDITNEILNGDSPSSNRGVIVSYLFQIIKVFIIGFRRYPILAAVYIDTCFSLICATLYVWFDFSISIVYSGLCRSDFYFTEEIFNKTESNRTIRTIRNYNYYGTGSTLIFLQLFTDIPRYLCLAYISIKLPMLFFKRLRNRNEVDSRLTREQKNLLHASLPDSVESQYVKNLFARKNTETPGNIFMKIARFIYAWRDDFRFSSRVVCLYASVFLMLFFLTVQFCVQVPPRLNEVQKIFQGLADGLAKLINSPDPNLEELENPPSDFPLPDFVRPYLIAVVAAFILTISQLLIMLAGIRRNLLQAFRGDDIELPRRTSSRNVGYAIGNFHFAGYLIGYVILAYTFLLIICLIIVVAIDAYITFGSVKVLETLLKLIIPALLFISFKLYLNKILGQCVFLQYGGDVLSINNRRAFMVFIYFNFFLDSFLGFFAAITRLLKSCFGGIIFMCRLDYSPLGRKLETMDAGFNAYCGFIYMEFAHRHPIVLCFLSHLLRGHLYPTTTKRLSKARHKWHLAVFLLNNPALSYRRKELLARLKANDKKNKKEIYIEQPPIFDRRTSNVSEKALQDLWEQQKF